VKLAKRIRQQKPGAFLFVTRGFTLLELTIVVAILAVIAMVAFPNFSSTDLKKLDHAAEEIMQAIRMARSESIRTGNAHGLTISQATQIVEVKKYDLTTDPISTDYKLYHPLEKQIYQFDLDEEALIAGVKISNAQDAFLFSDSARRKSVLFDHTGAPFWFLGSTDKVYQLVDGKVELSYAGQIRSIIVAPLTGRVTSQ
jgi:prepilin-type N-terminal cleavage/methylation domain-containing protein